MRRRFDFISPETYRRSMRQLQRIGTDASRIARKPLTEPIARLTAKSDLQLEEEYSVSGLTYGSWEYGPIDDYFLLLSPGEYVNTICRFAEWVLQYADIRGYDSCAEAKEIIVASRILATNTDVLAEQFKQHRKIYK